MSEKHHDDDIGRPDRPKAFEIKIDRTTYKVSEPVLTGEQLRRLPEPTSGLTVICSRSCPAAPI